MLYNSYRVYTSGIEGNMKGDGTLLGSTIVIGQYCMYIHVVYMCIH